jgi:hypothetical protein
VLNNIQKKKKPKNPHFIFTIVDAGLLVLKVEDGGELCDAELRGKVRVVRLDELDAHGVSVVVNLLQLLDGFVASGTVRSVCKNVENLQWFLMFLFVRTNS